MKIKFTKYRKIYNIFKHYNPSVSHTLDSLRPRSQAQLAPRFGYKRAAGTFA